MILAVDVAYHKDAATVGGILFRDWTDAVPLKDIVVSCTVPDTYIPGRFYRRELPCITALLNRVSEKLDCILIDGFVTLGQSEEPGLGKHLYDMLEQKLVVIGVAKTPFKDTPVQCAVRRGSSSRPLYVTAAGLNLERAKLHIRSMHGRGRLPTLLKYVDQLSKKKPRI